MRKKIKKYLLCLLTGLMALAAPLTVSAEGTSNYTVTSV